MAYQSKNHRKFLATSLTAAMVASAVAPAVSAASFPDVKEDNFYASYVNQLADAGIIEGMPNGTFGLRAKVTRAEAAKMVSLIRDLDTKTAPAANFEDVKQGVWYSEYINALYQEKLVDGISDEEFAPNGTLTRAQFAKLVVDAYDLDLKPQTTTPFTDVKENVWYTDYVKTLYANGLINGKTATTFEPNSTIDRADFAKLLVDADLKFGFTLGKAEVTAVSSVNEKTIQLTGTGLKNLKAEDITVEGNTVVSVSSADGKTATVTLKENLMPGTEYKVTVKHGDKTSEFTLKYTFEVSTATITTTTVDANKTGQKLALNVNGSAANLDYLVNAAGWKVEFQADKDVFKGTTTKTSATGEIDPAKVSINQTFSVKAVLTKLGVSVETPLVEVRVIEDVTPVIGSLVFNQTGIGNMSSKTLVVGESASVAGVYSNTEDVIKISGNATYASSNPAVAVVSGNNITAIAPGKTTITVTAGKEKYTTELTVTNVARTASKAVPAKSTYAVAPGVSPVVDVDVLDQYGDALATSNTEVTAQSSLLGTSPVPLTVNPIGETSVTVPTTKTTASGTYTVYLKNGNTNIGSFNVSVSADNVGNTPKLELAGSSKASINVGKSTTLNANLYTTSGGFTETLKASADATAANSVALVSTDGTVYSAEVLDSSVAKLSTTNNGTGIVVTAGTKTGSTEVVLEKGTQQVAKFTVTVTDTAVRVTSVTWKANNNTVTNKDVALTYKDAVTVTTVQSGDPILSGFNLSETTTSKVRVVSTSNTTTGINGLDSKTADVYLDKDDDGVLDAGEKLGELSVRLTGATNLSLTSLANLDTTAVGDKGTFIFTFKDTVTPSAPVLTSTTLNVDVK